MFAICYLDPDHWATPLKAHGCFEGTGQPDLPRVYIHICSRGDGEGDGGVGCVSEEGELECDVLVELHADGVGLLYK